MASEQVTAPAPESNPTTTAPATINYTSFDGDHITTLQAFGDALDELAWSLEEEGTERRGKVREVFQSAAKAVRGLMPDEDAMSPQSDPIAEARRLLLDECIKAQELLMTEAARVKKEVAIREAFALPSSLLFDLVDAIAPGKKQESREAAFAILERAGWSVRDFSGNGGVKYIKGREPLRKLAELREKFPIHYLRAHVEEVLDLALTWCKGASLVYGNGQPPEGVLYPHITVDMLPFPSGRDVPKEYRERPSVVEVEATV